MEKKKRERERRRNMKYLPNEVEKRIDKEETENTREKEIMK